jgi:hypothetical protein
LATAAASAAMAVFAGATAAGEAGVPPSPAQTAPEFAAGGGAGAGGPAMPVGGQVPQVVGAAVDETGYVGSSGTVPTVVRRERVGSRVVVTVLPRG